MSYVINSGLLAKLQAKYGAIFADAPAVTIEDLRFKMAEFSANVRKIQDTADSEGRELTVEERDQINAYMDAFDNAQADVERRLRMQEQAAMLEEPVGRQVEPEQPGEAGDVGAGVVTVAAHQAGVPAAARPQTAAASAARRNAGRIEEGHSAKLSNWGFGTFGEFAVSVLRASVKSGAKVDPRLTLAAPTATSSEGVNADGGYAVPPDFRAEIMRKVIEQSPLLGMTDQLTSSSNNITFPKDETTPWQTTGGVRVNWTGEGTKIAESKVELGEQTIKLEKLAALLPVTEELLEDAPALGRYLMAKVPENMGFAIDNAIINGTGTGQPLGILQSGALVTMPAEASQVADTITFDNIVSMWSRMYGRGQNNSVWIVNPAASAQFMRMSFPGTGTAVPVYLPPNGLAGTPYATLMGRPVIPTEAANAVGDVGDIILADMSKYMTVQKTIGMRADTSIHLYFDYDVTAFRFIIRIGGKPWWEAPITGKDGTTHYSAFVALAERA